MVTYIDLASPHAPIPVRAFTALMFPSHSHHLGTTAASDTWPPHCSSIVFELCDNGALRVLYQFEEILPAMPMAAAESDLFAPLMSSEAEHAKLCGLSDADGGAFRWGD